MKGAEIKTQNLIILKEIMKEASKSDQPEFITRVLVAIGTSLWEDPSKYKIRVRFSQRGS